MKGDIAISNLSNKRAVPRTAKDLISAWELRTALVKKELATESAANDAKTARLKALRLEKEAQDAEAARLAGPTRPERKKRPAKQRS